MFGAFGLVMLLVKFAFINCVNQKKLTAIHKNMGHSPKKAPAVPLETTFPRLRDICSSKIMLRTQKPEVTMSRSH